MNDHQNSSTDQAPCRGRILVVDDEDALRMIVQMSANMLGLEVLEAENGIKALEIIRNTTVDLIISDLMMPEMGGLELLRMLRQEKNSTRFIIVTGYGDRKKIDEAKALDVFAFVDKPYEIPVFEEVIARAMVKDDAA